jgi:RimJ/RimL family protein N-acetyltransferase
LGRESIRATVLPILWRCLGMILRVATADDLPFLLRLRNDPETRKWSRTTEEISEEAHAKWFAETTDRIFIATHERLKTGTVRFVRHPHEVEMGIVIAPEHRGKGYAAEMIRLGVKEAWAPVVAYVRVDNDRSLRAFERAGFTRDDLYVRFTADNNAQA